MATILRLVRYLDRSRSAVALAIIALVGSSLLGLVSPRLVQSVIDQALIKGSPSVLGLLSISVLGLAVISAYLAYTQAAKRAGQKNTPLFLAAFSLGGLIGLDLFASNPDVQFDKMVLFAPAIALRPVIYLERALAPFPQLVIPSLAPESYLANKKGTPVAAYNALFEGLYHFEEKAGSKLNVPTLIFIDEQDEFIPLWKLKKLVEENQWDQWGFHTVQKEEKMKTEAFHHHIIDAGSVGNAVWQDIMKAVESHLLDHTSD